MKKLVIAVAAFATMLSSFSAKAQDDKYGPQKDECLKYLSYYEEYFKQKNYDDAIPNWRQAYKYCPPESRQTMLVNGTTLMRKLISKNAKNPIYKQALIDTLMTLHDQRANFFPKNAVTARNNKGLDMAQYIKDDDQKLLDGYNAIIEANGAETKPNIFLFQLKAAIELYKIGMLTEEDVIEAYNRNVEIMDAQNPEKEADVEMLAKVRADHESLFVSSRVASCDKLIALFTPRYEAAPEDVELSQKIVGFMLKTEDCADNELMAKAIGTLYKSNPNASTAHLAFQVNSARGDINAAIKYLEEAVKQADPEVAGEYNYELAMYCYKAGMNQRAIQAAQASISMDPSKKFAGRCYFLIANIWSTQKCEGNDIAKRAPFWVAVDFMNKAKAADETLADECNKRINEFKKYYPSTADAFMYDLQPGHSYEVNCNGMRATTTVRTQD